MAERSTVKVSNIPTTAVAIDIVDFLEKVLGQNSVYACSITSDYKNWKSRGYGRVQFANLEVKAAACNHSHKGKLIFRGRNLVLTDSIEDVVLRPVEIAHRQINGVVYVGFMIDDDHMSVLESWEEVRVYIMPDRKRMEFVLDFDESCFKLEMEFEDVMETCGCRLGDEGVFNAFLFKLKHASKIFKRISGPNVASRFHPDRYNICKDDVEFVWVRSTEFSAIKSIGHSTALCWELEEGSPSTSLISGTFPCYREDLKDLVLEDGEEYGSATEFAPLINPELASKLSYQVLYQLNSLIHSHKVNLSSVNTDLISLLRPLDDDTTITVLNKLHNLKSMCYDPSSFIRTHLHFSRTDSKNLPSSSLRRLREDNLMTCHRVLVTPTKIYCMGPELESSNYVVKHFSSHASDFLRVSFVEEDWSKLPSSAISFTTHHNQGVFSKPAPTAIYGRIFSILRDGLVIGPKRFEFLAFSASQLRSNSVWMFASNGEVTVESIREWMGSFRKIRSVAKCAARMGQLFSSSVQALAVPAQDMEVIPDIEVVSDGVSYCFSDGIGKISFSFARQVAQRCGLTHTPSAFQIRYGGYKGMIAVDSNTFRKLSLRRSMLKFDSQNRMLNITSWSESMPCYLNREIISLLSTLGVEDMVFLRMQSGQIHNLDRMLTDREAALGVLETMSGVDRKRILVDMLNAGYNPGEEPFLSMMLQGQRENQLCDLRSRCRISVPKGRVLIGCLDEVGVLDYGQIFVRVTLTKSEKREVTRDLGCFLRLDGGTGVVVGKVVVTKNPCLHPGDIRVLEAVNNSELEERGFIDCLVFPQKGERPHPNECSGGDLDGDLFFVSWDPNLIPVRTDTPMDYTGRRPRIMDHDITLQEIQEFFIDYMINDSLGTISTAHLVHADREPEKARSGRCLELAALHSMAVDFAKTGAPAIMPMDLKPREFPDFMERTDSRTYSSTSVLGKLYRALTGVGERSGFSWSERTLLSGFDPDLVVPGYEEFIETAGTYKGMYGERMGRIMRLYGAEGEDEVLTGNLRKRSAYLLRDNRKYGEVRDRMSASVKRLQEQARGWVDAGCGPHTRTRMGSAVYVVTYHRDYYHDSRNCLSFPWLAAGGVLLNIKSLNSKIYE